MQIHLMLPRFHTHTHTHTLINFSCQRRRFKRDSDRVARSALPWPTRSTCTRSFRRSSRGETLSAPLSTRPTPHTHICVLLLLFHSLDKAVEDVKFRMSRYSVTPNVRCAPLGEIWKFMDGLLLTRFRVRVSRRC